jgi:hypothetical protein
MTQAGARDGEERPWLTLTEAAALSGRHIDALRAMARRGRIDRRKNNAGQWVVRLPESWPQAGVADALGNLSGANSADPSGIAQGDASGAADALAELREEVAELRVALARAEAKAEAITAVAKSEVEAAKRVAAAEVEAMREQLETGSRRATR